MTASGAARLVAADLPDPSKYSYTHGLQVGPLLSIAGQCGMDDNDEVVSPHFGDQARRVLERMEAVVRAAGGTRADIVAMTVFVTDIRDGPEFTRIRKEFFGNQYPTSALVEIGRAHV